MPELDKIQQTIDALYGSVDGYGISQEDRVGDRAEDRNFTYGEMLLGSFSRILDATAPQPGEVFYDLGSGTGKVVLMANMLAPFARTVGIEYLPKLHAQATEVVARYQTDFQPAHPQATGAVLVRHGDMLTENISDADVVFVHATCMSTELITALGHRVRDICKPTTRFALMSRGFFGLPWFKCTDTFEYANAWKTQSTCLIYRFA